MTYLKRVSRLPASDVARLLNFNPDDNSFGMFGPTRDMLNKELASKFEEEEIDEIELLIIEEGL